MKKILRILMILVCSLFTPPMFTGCDSSEEDRINASDPALPTDEPETDNDYIGLSRQQAETRAAVRNQPYRFVSIDGVSQPVTADFSPDRLNFTLQNGIVVAISRG